jgi:hypothetical protein
MMSLDNAFSRRRAGGVGRPARRDAGERPVAGGFCCELKIDGVAISLRYEDGAPGAGRHPGRRPGRRGRHRQRAHHRRRAPRTAGRAPRCWRCGARSTCRPTRSPGSRPPSRRRTGSGHRGRAQAPPGGRATPATPPPGRCARRTPGHRRPRAVHVVLPARRGGGRPGLHQPRRRPWTGSASGASPVNPEMRVVDTPAEVAAFCRPLAGPPPRPPLRDRRRGGEGRRPRPARGPGASPPGRPGGPSPTSSRPRSAPPVWWPSRCRWAAPAGSRRTPCSSRSSSAASPSPTPPSTTRTR